MNKRELQGVLKRPIAFYRIFAEIGGGAVPGLFLSQAHYWSDKTNDPDGWFYKSREEWEQETALKRDGQETARKELKKRGLLHEDLRGLPARLHYRVDYDAVCAAIEAWLNRLDAPAPENDHGEPSPQLGAIHPSSWVQPTQQAGGNQPNKAGRSQPAISTETTSESTQTNGHSIKSSKTNGNSNASQLGRAAELALLRLDPGEQKFARDQAKREGRPLHELMWQMYNAYMTEALRGLK